MANATKLKDSKFSIVKPPADVLFLEPQRESIYITKLREAITAESVIQILSADTYILNQLKGAAKKIKVKLVYGNKAEYLYVKPVPTSGEFNRLVLYLREKRTMNELRGFKLELDLEDTLKGMAKEGLAHTMGKDGAWVLTDKGYDLVSK